MSAINTGVVSMHRSGLGFYSVYSTCGFIVSQHENKHTSNLPSVDPENSHRNNVHEKCVQCVGHVQYM